MRSLGLSSDARFKGLSLRLATSPCQHVQGYLGRLGKLDLVASSWGSLASDLYIGVQINKNVSNADHDFDTKKRYRGIKKQR